MTLSSSEGAGTGRRHGGRSRRPGLQNKWGYVVGSLESIIPIYERGSSRIALFSDAAMRDEVVRSAVKPGSLVLDVGAGPGTMTRLVEEARGVPVMLDASRKMLLSSRLPDEKVQGTFEHLPFRDSAFDAVVAGFALRDSNDLVQALTGIRDVLKPGGCFSFCDLGKPESAPGRILVAMYVRVAVPVIGLMLGGRKGLGFASLYQTFLLTLDNGSLRDLLHLFFPEVSMTKRQFGGAIVVRCSRRNQAVASRSRAGEDYSAAVVV